MRKKGKIELLTDNLYGFTEKQALKLLEKKKQAYIHYWKWCGKRYEREFPREDGKAYAKKMYTKEINDYLLTREGQEITLKELANIKKAIQEKRLVVRWIGGLYWTTGLVEDSQITGISLINMKTLCPYKLNYDKRAYCVSCYGTSRPLEIILNYGYNLGLSFKDIPQNQQILY